MSGPPKGYDETVIANGPIIRKLLIIESVCLLVFAVIGTARWVGNRADAILFGALGFYLLSALAFAGAYYLHMTRTGVGPDGISCVCPFLRQQLPWDEINEVIYKRGPKYSVVQLKTQIRKASFLIPNANSKLLIAISDHAPVNHEARKLVSRLNEG